MFVSDNGIQEDEYFYIVLEWIRGGEFFTFIELTGKLPEDVARYYFLHLLDSLEHMQNKGISHRDLKMTNVMLDEEFHLKVIDFGFASLFPRNETFCGTGTYMAPELWQQKEYSGSAVDIFAAGVMLFFMVAGHPPFGTSRPTDQHYTTIVNNRGDLFWLIQEKALQEGEEYSESFKDLILNLLALDPKRRLTLSEIKAHSWVQGPLLTYEEVYEELNYRRECLEKSNLQSDQDTPYVELTEEDYSFIHRGPGAEEVKR